MFAAVELTASQMPNRRLAVAQRLRGGYMANTLRLSRVWLSWATFRRGVAGAWGARAPAGAGAKASAAVVFWKKKPGDRQNCSVGHVCTQTHGFA